MSDLKNLTENSTTVARPTTEEIRFMHQMAEKYKRLQEQAVEGGELVKAGIYALVVSDFESYEEGILNKK